MPKTNQIGPKSKKNSINNQRLLTPTTKVSPIREQATACSGQETVYTWAKHINLKTHNMANLKEPHQNCPLCPRLHEFRQTNQQAHPTWFNGAVPAFGNMSAKLLIVGLAPGLQGANRTGRPFTGDYAGDLLYPTLLKFGLAEGTYKAEKEDGLILKNCRITNAVRCVPPQNKPLGDEIKQCLPFLTSECENLPNATVIISLGRIAHDAVVRSSGGKLKDYKFAHHAQHDLPTGKKMINSYHCSRYNTNTGRLTTEMFEAVFETATSLL